MKLKLSHIVFFLFLSGSVLPQSEIPGLWLEKSLNYEIEKSNLQNPQSYFHSSLLPFLYTDSAFADSLSMPRALFPATFKAGNLRNSITFYPLLTLTAGYEWSDAPSFKGQLGGGLVFAASLGKRWEFYASAYFESINAPNYLQSYIDTNGVVPSMGRSYQGLMNSNFSRFDGFVRFWASRDVMFEAGIGKQFTGEGYRSLLWSDNAAPAPYFRFNVNLWHLNFSTTYTYMQDLSGDSAGEWQTAGKFIARHYLSWNISRTVEIGFFEAVVWQTRDENYYRGFDFNYLNPFAFYRPIEYSIGSADNALMGLNFKFDLAKSWTIYTQFMLDEFLLSEIKAGNGWWGNKFAFQAGVKINKPKSFYRFEFNLARPFTYSHGSVKQNYAYWRQPVAHQLGANFYEWLAELRFKLGKRGYLNNFLMYYTKGEDPPGEKLGGDINKPYTNPTNTYGNTIGQGNRRNVAFYRVQYNYLISPENNLNLIAGMQFRFENYLEKNNYSQMIYIGITTAIWNRYTEF